MVVRNPGGINEEQGHVIGKIAGLMKEKWGIDVYIGREDDIKRCSVTDVSGMCELGVKNRETVKHEIHGL